MSLIRISPYYFKRWHFLIVALLLLQLFLRTHNSLALPGYADESHHIRRAEVAWNFNVDGYASYIPGKLLLYYYLGLFETSRQNYLLVSRLAVALITLLGGAGIYAIGKQLVDQRIGMMALFVYTIMPLTVFHDRMALADPLALALLMVATWALLLWLQKPTLRRGAAAGLLLILPPLAKLTAMAVVAAPFLMVVVFDFSGWRKYRRSGALMLGMFALLWIPMFTPTVIGEIRGGDNRVVLVGDYLLNIHEENQGFVENFFDNIRLSVEQTAQYYWTPALVLTLLAWIGLLYRRRQVALFLAGMLVLAWLPTVAVGSFPSTRYLEIGVPFLILMLIAGLYELSDAIEEVERRATIERAVMMGCVVYGMSWGLTFFYQAVTDPADLDIPTDDRWRYVQSVTAGYGQQDAVVYLEDYAARNPGARTEVYGILGSCHLMRLFMRPSTTLNLTCAHLEPGRQLAPETISEMRMAAELANGGLFILLERDLGSNFADLGLEWTFVRLFPRPHEGVTLELWQVALPGEEGAPAFPNAPPQS